MKKIATITLHGAHNFGSMLQTYALQNFVTNLCKDNNRDAEYCVINLRNSKQKSLYSNKLMFNSVSNIIKSVFKIVYKKQLSIKHNKFETFLNDYINLTEEFTDDTLAEEKVNADYYISGSDQVFNIRALDFSWRFLLDFVSKGKKISYSASCGPLMIDWSLYDKDRYVDAINDFDSYSVREEKSRAMITDLGADNISINVDPTLLLSKEQWYSVQSDANYNNGRYILLYCLEPTIEQLNIAKAVSKKLNLPIVVTRYNSKVDIINPFIKKYDSGPRDFLSYIDNAELVLTSSFHGTAFSIIYNKKFYALNGLDDNRISSILKSTELTHRVLDGVDDVKKVDLADVDFAKANEFINVEKEKSSGYLKQALDM